MKKILRSVHFYFTRPFGREHWLAAFVLVFLTGATLYHFSYLPVTAEAQGSGVHPSAWTTDGTVNAVVSTATTTYIGGNFSQVSPRTGGGAEVNTASGAVSSLPAVNGTVYATVADGAGGWFIGGDFTQVGAETRNRLAHFLPSGGLDADWNVSAGNTVYSLALSPDKATLYIGGIFSAINGQGRQQIASVVAATGALTDWEPYVGSVDPDQVKAIVPSPDGLLVYIGGSFELVGPLTKGAELNNTTGAVTNPVARVNQAVRAVISDGVSGWYIGGDFTEVGNEPRTYVAHVLASGVVDAAFNPVLDGGVETLALSPDHATLYMGGSFTSVNGTGRQYFSSVSAVNGALSSLDVAPNRNVQTVALNSDGGHAYLGGNFTTVGHDTHGAALDPVSGEAMTPFPFTNNWVTSSVADGAGGWYIGGNFTQVGGLAISHLAHVLASGEADPDFHPNPDGEVMALALSGNTLFAGGQFFTIGGEARSYLAAVDKTTGETKAWNPQPDNAVYSIALHGSTIYVGGAFVNMNGGSSRGKLAAFDYNQGTGDATLLSWDPQAGPSQYHIYAVAVSPDGKVVYAGGDNFTFHGISRVSLAALHASGEPDEGFPLDDWNFYVGYTVRAIVATGDRVYLGGSFGYIVNQTTSDAYFLGRLMAIDAAGVPNANVIASFNPGADSEVDSIAVDGNRVYAAGSFFHIGGAAQTYFAAVDADTGLLATGPGWNPAPNNSVHTVSVSPGKVFAGGNFTRIGGAGSSPRNYLAEMDTVTGALLTWDPSADDSVKALAVSPDDSAVYAGGNFTNIAGQDFFHVAALNSVTGDALPGWSAGINMGTSVNTLAVTDSLLYIGGAFPSVGGAPHFDVAALDRTNGEATAWNPQLGACPDTYRTVYAVALSPDQNTVYIGGDCGTAGGETRNNIAAVNASDGALTGWDPNADGIVRALAASGNKVYAGGDFASIGGYGAVPRPNLAALDAVTADPTEWNPSPDGTVKALVLDGTTLYAGGDFTNIGSHIAAISTGSGLPDPGWTPSVSGNGNAVNALAVTGSLVYAGGSFSSEGEASNMDVVAIRRSDGIVTDWNANLNNCPDVTTVYALAVTPDENTVYIGGDCGGAAGQSRPNLAAVNASDGLATNWNPSPDGTVKALALNSDASKIYVGGEFTTLGAESRNYIAAFDNATGAPTSFAPSLDSAVQTLALNADQSTLYVGGDFSITPSEPFDCSLDPGRTRHPNGCHRYDGDRAKCETAWINGGSGVASCWYDVNGDSPSGTGPDTCEGCGSTNLSAGLCENTCAGTSRTRLAAFSTTTGQLTNWKPTADSTVRSLKVSGDTVYIGGDFSVIRGQTRNYLAAVDATNGNVSDWNPNMSGSVQALLVIGSTVYAGGDFHQIGENVTTMGAVVNPVTGELVRPVVTIPSRGFPDIIQAAVPDGSGGWYIGGHFVSFDGSNQNETLMHIFADGTPDAVWSLPYVNSTGDSISALYRDGNTLYVGGDFTSIDGQTRNNLAAIDTTTGHVTPWIANVDNGVRSIVKVGNTVYVGGNFTGAYDEFSVLQPRGNAAAFDATSGNLTPWDSGSHHAFNGTTILETDGNVIYAGGYGGVTAFTLTDGAQTPFEVDTGDTVFTLKLDGTTLYMGGAFQFVTTTTDGTVDRNGIAAIDTVTDTVKTWNPGVGRNVDSIAVAGGTIYVGLDFGSGAVAFDADGNPLPWNPNLTQAGGNFVQTLASDGTNIYVGGSINTIGTPPTRNYLAAIDAGTGLPTSWDPEPDNRVLALENSEDGNTIYAGGEFSNIGPNPHWDLAAIGAADGVATSWDPQIQSTHFSVHSLLRLGSTLYIGGSFYGAGGQPRNNAAAVSTVDGSVTDWTPEPDNYVYSMAANPAGTLISIGGEFSNVGGQPHPYFAQFIPAPEVSAPETGRSHPLAESHPDLSSSGGGAPSGDVQNGPFNLNISFRVKVKNVRDKLVLDRIKAVTHQQYDSLDAILSDATAKARVLSFPDIGTAIKGQRETFVMSVWPRGSRRGALFTQTVTTNLLGEASLTLASFPPGFYDFTLDTPQALRTALNNVDARYQGVTLDFTRGNNEELHYGDFNGDGKIDLSDITAAITALQSTDSARRQTVDLNEDGTVDLSDFAKLIQNWGQGQ